MKETMRGEPSVSESDIRQKEAELEKSSKEQMGHMEVEKPPRLLSGGGRKPFRP
jgi:hypothetical protein